MTDSQSGDVRQVLTWICHFLLGSQTLRTLEGRGKELSLIGGRFIGIPLSPIPLSKPGSGDKGIWDRGILGQGGRLESRSTLQLRLCCSASSRLRSSLRLALRTGRATARQAVSLRCLGLFRFQQRKQVEPVVCVCVNCWIRLQTENGDFFEGNPDHY